MLKWLISFRILNSLLVRSYFSPDEYWQSLEVAHKLTFGYGELTWEWEDKSLRSILHPGLFAFFYWILLKTGLDSPWMISYGPRMLQGTMLGVSDYFIFKTSGSKGLFFSLTSWFLFYAGVRTYSNSVELMLNSIAFYLLQNQQVFAWNCLVGLCCMIRPTAILIWIPSYLSLSLTRRLKFLTETFIIAYFLLRVFCITVQVLIDSWYFGKVTVTFWNFLFFNFLSDGSEFYGRQPWHWMVTDGLLVVFASYFPVLLLALVKGVKNLTWVSYVFFLLAISLSVHKEYRFLLSSFPQGIYLMSEITGCISRSHYFLAVVQIGIALFLSLFHQVAPLAVMDFLQTSQASSVGFFINCHGTPFYSHLHRDIPMRFLQCRPFETQETLEFYKNPEKVLTSHLASMNYSHIVIWSTMYPKVESVLSSYNVTQKFFHAFWTESFEGYESNVYFYLLSKISS